MYRLGGVASLAIGAAYIVIIGLYAFAGVPPVGGEAWLNYPTGILGIAAVAGVSIATILNAVSATIWLFLVGYRLYRLTWQ